MARERAGHPPIYAGTKKLLSVIASSQSHASVHMVRHIHNHTYARVFIFVLCSQGYDILILLQWNLSLDSANPETKCSIISADMFYDFSRFCDCTIRFWY